MYKITRNTAENRFEVQQNGRLAVADYVLAPHVMTVTHIIVPESLQGRGVASALAAAVVRCAREEGRRIKPQCSFMASYLQRHPEESDVVA